MNKQKIIFGILCAIICQVLFGFSFLFTKNITNSVSPMTLLGWRFLVAFLMINVCVLLRIIKVDFRGKGLAALVLVAIFQPVLYFVGETFGVNLTTASESGTIIAAIPIVAILCSAVLLKETPTKIQALGVAITSIGIVVVVLVKGLDASFNIIGYAMLMLAVFSHSLYSVFSQKAKQFTSMEKTYVMMGFGAIVFPTITLFEHFQSGTLRELIVLPFTNLDFLIAILYLSIGSSIIGFLLYNLAIENIGTNKTASFVGITTIVTVSAGVIILKESFSIYQGLGTLLVLGGVYLANMLPKDKEPEGVSYPVEDIELA